MQVKTINEHIAEINSMRGGTNDICAAGLNVFEDTLDTLAGTEFENSRICIQNIIPRYSACEGGGFVFRVCAESRWNGWSALRASATDAGERHGFPLVLWEVEDTWSPDGDIGSALLTVKITYCLTTLPYSSATRAKGGKRR